MLPSEPIQDKMSVNDGEEEVETSDKVIEEGAVQAEVAGSVEREEADDIRPE